MKILIFYSSIGNGHISAARSIEKEILKKDPFAVILQKDIREFMDPMTRILDEKLYWFVAKNLPFLFDNIFQSMHKQRKCIGSLNYLPSDYSEKRVCEYIIDEAPDAVFTTHYGAAQVLGNLREKALMPNIKIGWLHTDYFVGYFPRISKRIDRTFLAHPALETSWLESGVFSDLVETSGMPVNVQGTDSDVSKECLSKIGFQSSIKTIVLASGKEGVGNFPEIVINLANATEQPLQIIAVCGRNKKQHEALNQIRHQMPKQVKLEIMGFIPQIDLLSFINASDLFITKAGGLAPSEAFVLGKPTILLSVISGHEKENAKFFSKLGLAEINYSVEEIGRQAQLLLKDVAKQTSMLKAQQVFRENIEISKIADFLLSPKIVQRGLSPEFGLENGYSACNIQSALAQLENNVPADIEILLSYSSSKEDERIAMENPFGHIAIRIGDTVYSSNHHADPAKDSLLLQQINLSDYLFGVVNPTSSNQEHTSTYGIAYGRDTLGFRIKGIPPEAIQRMHAEAAKIEKEFSMGQCRYDVKKSNCADYAERILKASGYYKRQTHVLSSIYTMPLDVFEKAQKNFKAFPSFCTELVAYRRLSSSKSPYRFSRFPLSLGQPVRSFAHIINNSALDPLESKVDAQLTGYYGDDRILYEELNPYWRSAALNDFDSSQIQTMRLENTLILEVHRLFKQNKMKQGVEQKICRLIDNASNEMIVVINKISAFYENLEQDAADQDLKNLTPEMKTISTNLENRVERLFGFDSNNLLPKHANNKLKR
ncbi:MAG: hypothetical protein KK926_09415 [Methanomethylovorans sp.]|nr:hypothetical protein [Methanomethylovorans sp.]